MVYSDTYQVVDIWGLESLEAIDDNWIQEQADELVEAAISVISLDATEVAHLSTYIDFEPQMAGIRNIYSLEIKVSTSWDEFPGYLNVGMSITSGNPDLKKQIANQEQLSGEIGFDFAKELAGLLETALSDMFDYVQQDLTEIMDDLGQQGMTTLRASNYSPILIENLVSNGIYELVDDELYYIG